MDKCVSNINNDRSNVLFQIGLLSKNMSLKDLNERRSFLFKYICVPLRILLYLFLLIFRDTNYKIVNNVVQLVCIISFIHLQTKTPQSKKCQWWSNDLEQIVTLIIYIIAEICNVQGKNCIVYIVPVLILDVISGLIQMYIKQPFNI